MCKVSSSGVCVRVSIYINICTYTHIHVHTYYSTHAHTHALSIIPRCTGIDADRPVLMPTSALYSVLVSLPSCRLFVQTIPCGYYGQSLQWPPGMQQLLVAALSLEFRLGFRGLIECHQWKNQGSLYMSWQLQDILLQKDCSHTAFNSVVSVR